MLILELAAGILPGIAIVFSGVWMALYWRVIGAAHRRALSIAMAASLIVVLIGFLRVAPATLIIAVFVLLLVTIVFGMVTGSRRIGRSPLNVRPGTLARMLHKPLTWFFGAAAVLSTVALFATLQRGPQPDLPIFELSGIAAGLWALMLVGGVWAKKHMPPSRPAAHRRDAASRYAQSPFRKFPG